ncbi:hypothetical protein [Streptomyces sp. CA-210063]|uniref:hypothetical protein n=1 Tax=Streptomyces sp. CA-210063 TaxID=2801029 RepID=UPI0027D451D3|nr:hypothetical protein [Streptomyces sp. CA-210063]
MSVQLWDAGLDEAEWQAWLTEGHDFGQPSANGLPGHPPVAVPTDGVPTSYCTAVQFTAAPISSTAPRPRQNCWAARSSLPTTRRQRRRRDRVGPQKP